MRTYYIFLLTIFLVFAISCAPYRYEEGRLLPLKEFAKKPPRYDGKGVVMRGYLGNTGGDLVLYEHAENLDKDSVLISIIDPSEDRRLSKEYEPDNSICTYRYVEITGVVGFYELRQLWGITELKKIDIYTDDQYNEPGEVCFENGNYIKEI